MTSRPRALVVGSIATALAATSLTSPAAGVGAGVGALDARSAETQIAVSVATLWMTPTSPRRLDARATAAPADPARWLRGLTTAGRRGLNGRVESQALYGQPVTVLEERGGWSRVVLPGQPSPKSPDGYPGWIPTRQLIESPATTTTDATAPAPSKEAVVTGRTTWAHATPTLGSRSIQLSYGTRLPALGRSARTVTVKGVDGRTLWLSAKRVKVVPAGASTRKRTGSGVVTEARKFLGLPYLWGGTSGFGFDCSGLTHAVYAELGVTIPRDATPQSKAGRMVSRVRDLRKGDLVFFRTSSGSIHHVGIYAGRGRMIHSPRTGQPVQVSSITRGIWAREFAGGRRYL